MDPLKPTPERERRLELDVLRALALFGVLVVNVTSFSGHDYALEEKLPVVWGWGGTIPSLLRSVFIESKAAALLGMLFGAGLVIQCERVARQGRSYVPFALRRAGALALIGLLHSVLLWNGDILLDYALLSLLMIPFVNWSARRILWAIAILMPVAILLAVLFERLAGQGVSYAAELQHYGAGTWWDALRFRTSEFLHAMGPQRMANRPVVLVPFFVLGAYFWKKGWFSDPAQHRRALTRVFIVCSLIGLGANLVPTDKLGSWLTVHLPVQPLRVAIRLTCFLGRPLLTVGYAAGLLLLMQNARWRRVLAPLAPLGRMTLTQYLLQSVVCTLVFNGYGLGLFGKVSVNACILGAVLFYPLQAWTSAWWLRRFETGPVEWFWRRMVYGTAVSAGSSSSPLRRSARPTPPPAG